MEWISVKDRLPDAGEMCRAKTLDGVDEKGEALFDGTYWWYSPRKSLTNFRLKEGFVTDWKPIEPPKQES